MSKQTLRRTGLQFPDLLRHVIAAWLIAVTLEFLLLPKDLHSLAGLKGLAQMSLPRVLCITAIGALLLCLAQHFVHIRTLERWVMVGTFAGLTAAVLGAAYSPAFSVVCFAMLFGFILYALYGWNGSPLPSVKEKSGSRIYMWITMGMALVFFLFVSIWTVSRVNSFCTPTYDFGIFSQMFYNMKESGLPITTVERDGPLSHFHVHMSPIYYLLLPFYMLIPTPGTLQVLQAAVVASSVIPLWLIGKEHGLNGLQRTLLCAVLLLYPAFSGGTSYDIHENCFLAPLLLWLLYGIDRRSSLITAIAAVLTLTVKEDAAVHVGIAAVYLIVRTLLHHRRLDIKSLITGIVLLAVSLGWFFAVTGFLAQSGDGVMTYRYDNFIYDGSSSLVTVIKAVIMSPMKAFYKCVDAEKLKFISLTMLPLMGLPFLTRRFERYILLIPYILVNLMSDYQYQHDIFFQYTFGSTACLVYLAAVNLADLKVNWKRLAALAAAVTVSAICFCNTVVPKAMYYPELCVQYGAFYDTVRDTLDKIPGDASVSATTFYTTYLSQREDLYDIRYSSTKHILETEYVAVSVTAESCLKKYATMGENNGFENFVKLLKRNGYTLFAELPGTLVIYQKTAD
ncbi:MAG: DUF2079 domain-containing protein [Oscillospiraceae bacterium]|nr:DUF2079 domain-containing protein [Oscillospiraceae bacterium]